MVEVGERSLSCLKETNVDDKTGTNAALQSEFGCLVAKS